MMSRSRQIHRSAPPENAHCKATRCNHGNPYRRGGGRYLRLSGFFIRLRVTFMPDSSSLELTCLTQPGPFSRLLCFGSLFDSFQLCLAHSYCNGLHSGGSMSSLFCCQGFRWMEGDVGSSGGEVKEGRVVRLPPECKGPSVFMSHTAAVARIPQI